MKPLFDQLSNALRKLPWLLFLVVIPVFLIEISLALKYPMTYGYTNDWYAFAYYGFLFLTGYLLISVKEAFWYAVQKLRYVALISGIVFFSLLAYSMLNQVTFELTSVFKVFNLWSWVIAIFGFSSKYLNSSSKVLAYRNEAVYPFYIIHQVVIITLGYYLMNVSMPIVMKFLIMVIGTVGITWLIYEFLIRRVGILRPLLA